MATNVSSGAWSVKMTSMPTDITVSDLSKEIQLPKSRIQIPKDQKGNSRHAWVNDFASKEEAEGFAQKWSSSLLLGAAIECVVIASKHPKFPSQPQEPALQRLRTSLPFSANTKGNHASADDRRRTPVSNIPLTATNTSETFDLTTRPSQSSAPPLDNMKGNGQALLKKFEQRQTSGKIANSKR